MKKKIIRVNPRRYLIKVTKMIKLTERQKLLLESASDWIQNNYSEAGLVGVAWWFLDCGCMAGMGFSIEAGIVTPAVRIDRELVEDGAVPECAKCSEHSPANLARTFTLGTTWFRPVLDSEIRDRIKKELFGPSLDKEVVEMYQEGEFQTAH
ncbi:MAG: hypothetical protein JSV47_07480 [Deltaproteobacteria bacterium]|nr:MAG: hypothetical protein JSV47_07480 [Deltaproteobacteria bacterium]